MAPGWQEIASLHVEQITGYVRETLSTGLVYLKSELGIDLGLNPDLCAPWLLLSTAWAGLVLILIVWVSVCRGLSKILSGTETGENIADNTDPAQTVKKADEPRRRNRKRNAEKVCFRNVILIHLSDSILLHPKRFTVRFVYCVLHRYASRWRQARAFVFYELVVE